MKENLKTTLISFICKYDVCLSETMLSDSPGDLPGFTSPYIINPKGSKWGRPSGGILIYTKPKYGKGISEIKQNNNSIWLEFDKNYFNTRKKSILMLCLYKTLF